MLSSLQSPLVWNNWKEIFFIHYVLISFLSLNCSHILPISLLIQIHTLSFSLIRKQTTYKKILALKCFFSYREEYKLITLYLSNISSTFFLNSTSWLKFYRLHPIICRSCWYLSLLITFTWSAYIVTH